MKGTFIYATNFRCGTVDVFDVTFKPTTLSGSFHDSDIPDGFAPFGIANIQGNLFVTFALQDAAKHDNVAGPGDGFVDIFNTDGNLIRRFASRGELNSPWGLARAPFNFGPFSNDVLIGNFGDGEIDAYDTEGHLQGELKDPSNKTIEIDGLWSLVFGGAKCPIPTFYISPLDLTMSRTACSARLRPNSELSTDRVLNVPSGSGGLRFQRDIVPPKESQLRAPLGVPITLIAFCLGS